MAENIKPSKTSSRIDCRSTICMKPVDFSFLNITSVHDLPKEEARSGDVILQKVEKKPETPPPTTQATSKLTMSTPLSFQKKAQSSMQIQEKKEPEIIEIRKYRATSIKLSNNSLKTAAGLKEALDEVLVQGSDEVLGLDLSFNQIKHIENELLLFPKLRSLNLQSNLIYDWNDIAQLRDIPNLKTLVLFGNPIDQLKYYRILTVAALPQLKTLDSTLISPRERDLASRWFEMHRLKLKTVMKERLPFAEKERVFEDDDDEPAPSDKGKIGSSAVPKKK
ncbi:putative Leucine-rich repeat-containing protein [Monocercomonoides exilis]|uniref:putative Leucine-rich repeat-containing protein n=1 Tax=Monocercomonoides exilis TaxID=2049356 RepID=UPI00355A5D37|nr:putative Leucine-rich repeat-containing protein [Monocercomonoides exilis]|eukprot:MONOS_264.1-p1 / transcript=MONOS_264.1 / gene=MONOS_264 / organism=Monocercomonoides_exilis_PA203 / gene_product=Leucine-rich repeat-containing protein / transcript_product=Leucine-rich repeat-containing protein / location=Mono_scaffold00004:166271-167327(-) / protein_length=278 / sequence_SO=supercontig / SO=protein_coding / is_pseudo=false